MNNNSVTRTHLTSGSMYYSEYCCRGKNDAVNVFEKALSKLGTKQCKVCVDIYTAMLWGK